MLVVTRPFGAYKRGDEITNAATEASVLAAARDHVVSVILNAAPAAKPVVTVTAPAAAKPVVPAALEAAIEAGIVAAEVKRPQPHPVTEPAAK